MYNTSAEKPSYPKTRTDDSRDTLSGVSFPDPYHWLEKETEETRLWQHAQADLASVYVREWPHFDRVRQLVSRFSIEWHNTLPRYAAGRWFRTRITAGASQAQALVSETAQGEGRVVFDPTTLDREQPSLLSWIAPSPDGRVLALGLCADGSENNTIRLVDVPTGRMLDGAPPQTLMDNWTGGVQWLPDSSGFLFSAITGTGIDFTQHVYLHRRVPTPTTVQLDIPWTVAKSYRMVLLSGDGRYVVALERHMNPIPVAIAELGNAPLQWRPFVTSIGDTVAGHIVGERYIAITDVDAPRGRVVAIPLNAQNPNDPQAWQELVPESDAVLRNVTPIGGVLYLQEFVDSYARIRLLNLEGKALGEVPLPGRGAVREHPCTLFNLLPKGHPERFIFGFSSLTVSPGIYSHRPGQGELEVVQEPSVRLENTVVEDRWAVSADGTRIPYHLVRRSDADTTAPQPTLIYAYGGFNYALPPEYPGPMAAFVAAGGVYVLAHLRGGGEFGREWWEGGRMRNKQNGYDDLFAVAEDLIAAHRTTAQTLAVTGGSNGGLMAGVAATQRPDLWGVVVPRVPFLDAIGGCRDPYGRWAVTLEMADIADADEVRRLATFSPYHLVREGVRYPAVFISAGDTDPRCPPWHARKLAARLQAASAASAPILVHVWENAGHGWATDPNTLLEQNTEWLAFTLRQLGVEPRKEDRKG